MLRSNSLLLLILILVTACTKHKVPQLLISTWEKSLVQSRVVERKLANAPQGQCLKDVFSVELLKEEVRSLEQNYSGNPVKGKWKHLKLSDLPISQGNFLERYGDKLGDVSGKTTIDFSLCQDVPCIINQIYGTVDGVAGYVHYLWFLKFGHMLSADNHVPTQEETAAGTYQGRAQEISKYLYNADELYGLWRLSLMLQASHSGLSNLKEIQRIPRGLAIEGRAAAACGVAYSTGHILLQDGCLTIYGDKDSGHLYAATAHEMNHMLDYKLDNISGTAEYRQLAGFLSTTDYLNEQQQMVRRWEMNPGGKHISDYAKTSPGESFAETLAYFRTAGEESKIKVSKELWAHTSERYYAGEEFDRAHLMARWFKKHAVELSKETLKAVVDCTAPDAATVKSDFFSAEDLQIKILPSVVNCLGFKAREISKYLGAKIAASEPEGCGTFRRDGAELWEKAARKELGLYIGKFLKELASDKDYVARINSFYNELSNNASARMAYLNCSSEADEQLCYLTEVNKLSREQASVLRLPESHTLELVAMYESFHPYQRVKQETERFYSLFVENYRGQIKTQASQLFQQCLAAPLNDDLPPQSYLFPMEEGYLVSSVHNCLVESSSDAIRTVITNMSVGELKVQHPQEEVILTREIQAVMMQELAGIYSENRSQEKLLAMEESARLTSGLRSSLLSDFNWSTDFLSSTQVQRDCEQEAARRIDFRPVYHLNKDLFAQIISQEICSGIEMSSEYNSFLEASKISLVQKYQEGMDKKLMELAQKRAQACVSRYPVNTTLNRIRYKKVREACLISEWFALEEVLLREFKNDPLVEKLKLPLELIKARFDQQRRKTQLKIFKDYFQG